MAIYIVLVLTVTRISHADRDETELKKQRGRPSSSPRLLPYVPTTDMQRRLEQMASLAAALTGLGVGFSDSLSYVYAPRTANRAAYEKGGMRVLHDASPTLILFPATCFFLAV